MRCETLLKQRDTDEALQAIAKAFQLEPRSAANFLARAKAFDARHDAAHAAEDRHQADEIKSAEALLPAVAMPAGPGRPDGDTQRR